MGAVGSLIYIPFLGDFGPIMGGALTGYMPLRGDYDVEHDNDAELVLADMEFLAADDTPAERALKLRVVQIYNAKARAARLALSLCLSPPL